MQPDRRELLAGLVDPATRAENARDLARSLGCDDLIVFVPDAQLGKLLPAIGFPQTLPGGRAWRTFIDRCVAEHQCSSTVRSPFTELETTAAGFARDKGAVIVLLGGAPDIKQIEELLWIVPLLALAFRGEHSEAASHGQIAIARDGAAKSQALAAALDEAQTRLQRALADAEAATRSQREFLAVVSHELRTPLTAILGWTRILRDGEDDAAIVNTALDTIERNVRSQTTLVDDILDYTRVISGKLSIQPKRVDLAQVVHDALKTVSSAAQERGVEVLSTGIETPILTLGDHDRLVQVVTNLLTNAIKFSRASGSIEVRMDCRNNTAEICVIDSGIGIAPAFLPFVFDRFRQADASTTRRHGGLGLGLAIVRQLIELHAGTVAVESAGEDLGSTFRVRIPIQQPDATTALATASSSGEESGVSDTAEMRIDNVRILLVEDYNDSRDFLTFALTRYGADVTAAASAAEAIRAFTERKFDIIVSDIELPEMDGYELIRSIRALQTSGTVRTPALALSAHTRPLERDLMIDAGFDLHVAKPIEPRALVATIVSLIEDVARVDGSRTTSES